MRNLITSITLLALTACGAPDVLTAGESMAHPLPEEGKADNYISTNAREYTLRGAAHVELPADFDSLDDEAKTTKLKSLADSRVNAVTRAIKSHIQEVLKPFNDGKTGEKANYFLYVKRDAGKHTDIELLGDGRAKVAFEMELNSHVWLMSKIAPNSGRRFEVEVKSWPANTGETIDVTIEGSDSTDAFPKYNELFEDGVFDIAVHFGGDYNKDRLDIGTATWFVEELIKGGFTSPGVTKFEELKIDSAPFTRQLQVNGKQIEVQIYVFHSDMVEPENEERLSDVMKDSFAARDVIIYSGHAGENAGFILDYQPKHEIKASTFKDLQMADKYQIFVLDGCRTYRTYVDDLMENPAKTFENTDIITTVNTTPFSVGYQLLWEFMYWFTLTDNDGNHFPLSWKAFLRGLNTDRYDDVHYGVHGVDQGPKLNPHGGAPACTPCTMDSDCGAGNLCLGYGMGAACGTACTTDEACGPGFRCARLTDRDDQFYIPKQCVKLDYDCSSAL